MAIKIRFQNYKSFWEKKEEFLNRAPKPEEILS